MKKFNLFLGGLMAIAFTACTNNDILPEENTELPSAKKTVITAYTPGDDSASSRVTQGDYKVGQTIPLTWDYGDQISVFYGGDTKTYTKSGEDKYTFTGDEFGDYEGLYFAFYPVLAEPVQSGNVPYDLSNQTGSDAYLMCAKSSDRLTYQFQHAAAYLKATFPESLKNTTATITITLPEGVYTKGFIDLENFTLRSNNEYKNTIIKTVEFGASTEVWFAIPPMATGDKKLNFKIKTSSNSYSATLAGSAEKAIEAGKYYSANIDMHELKISTLYEGSYVKSAMSTAANGKSIQSIVFRTNVNTSRFDGATSIEYTGNSNAYAKVEEDVLYILTEADEFVFGQYGNGCEKMFNAGDANWLANVKVINFNNCVNTSNVKSMKMMFASCSSLTSVDLSSFDTSEVTDMQHMFNSCSSLTSVDLSSFDTSKVTTMSYMFQDCTALTSLDLCNFNFASDVYVSDMFKGCSLLNDIYVNENFLDLLKSKLVTIFWSGNSLKTHIHQ